MDAGLVVGLSLGLAVLVLIILVFGCKFAKKNKEGIHDFAKEQLLGDQSVSRRRSSKTKSLERHHNDGTDNKETNHREKTRNKSVTFYDGDLSERIKNNDREEKSNEPRQQLFREYTECNDNNGIRRMDKWSRDCEMDCFGDYRERGCKRKKNGNSSERMKTRNSNKDDEGFDRRQKYTKIGKYNPQIEVLKDKEEGVHHYPLSKRKGQERVMQHATVKQIVEDVKRNSKHNLQNGTRIKVNYNTLYTDSDIEGDHLYKTKENINSSSGKGATQTQGNKKEVQNKESVRLMSRPQDKQQQFAPLECKEDYRQYDFVNATGHEPSRYRENEDTYTQWSAEDGPVNHLQGKQTSTSIPQVDTYPQSRSAPPVPILSSNMHQQLRLFPPFSIPLAQTHPQSRPSPPVSIQPNITNPQSCPALQSAHTQLQSRPALQSAHTQLQSRPALQSAHTQLQSRPALQSIHTHPLSHLAASVSIPLNNTPQHSRPAPLVTIPPTLTQGQSPTAPSLPEKPARIIYQQAPRNPFDFNLLTSTSEYSNIEPVLCACPFDNAAAESKEDLQFNDVIANNISDAEKSSFSEALATWVHHSETGAKIPRPSTTIPYITYSQRASTLLNVEPQNSKLKQNVASASGENIMSNTDCTRMPLKHAVPGPMAQPSSRPSVPPPRTLPSTSTDTSIDYQSTNYISHTEKQTLTTREPGDNFESQHSLSENVTLPKVSQHSPSRKIISSEASQHSSFRKMISPEASPWSPSKRLQSPEASQHSSSRKMASPEASQHSPSRKMISPEASQHSPSRKMISPEASQHSPSRKMISPEASQHSPSRKMISPEASQHSPSRKMISPEASQHSPSRKMISPEASQHSPSRKMISPEASQHTPSKNMISPEASQHSPSRKMISPEASQHSPSRKMISPEASQHTPSKNMISPEASQHSPSRKMISPEASQHSPSRKMISPEGTQYSPSRKISSLEASQRRQIMSPTKDQQTGLEIPYTDSQKSSTAKIQLQLSSQRNFQTISQPPFKSVEQSTISSLAPNVDPHVLPKVNILMLPPHSPDKKEAVQTLYLKESKLSPNEGCQPESQSEPPAALARLKPSPPPRPRQKSSKHYRSHEHITFIDTIKPLNQSIPNSADDQSCPILVSSERINQGEVSAEEYIPREQPENTLIHHVGKIPAKQTDLGNVNDKEEQNSFDAVLDEKQPKSDNSEEAAIIFKESVDVIASESEFNPGQTSTPQQSTTKVPDSSNGRSDRSVLHSFLKKRRGRIVCSSQDLSSLYTGEQDSFWDESISSIKKSVSFDGKDNADGIPINESLCRVKSDLTEKIATVRDIRNDPVINALLSDIKARKKSSSSFD